MTRQAWEDGWWATLPLDEVDEVVDFVLWDTPASMVPTPAKVCGMLAELAARADVADPIVQAAIAECWSFLEFEIKTCQ